MNNYTYHSLRLGCDCKAHLEWSPTYPDKWDPMYLTITSQGVPSSRVFYIKCSVELSTGIAVLTYHLEGDDNIIDRDNLLLNVDDNHRVNEWVQVIKDTAEGMVFSYSICPIVGVQGWVTDKPFSDSTLTWVRVISNHPPSISKDISYYQRYNHQIVLYLSINSEDYYDDTKRGQRLCECGVLLYNVGDDGALYLSYDKYHKEYIDNMSIVRSKNDVLSLINQVLANTERYYQSVLSNVRSILEKVECQWSNNEED